MLFFDLYYPALAQVGLTLFLLVWMGRVRLASLAQEKVRVSQIALGQRAWPERVQRVSNAYHNQLELPVLFYAVVIFAIQYRCDFTFMIVLAWAFVGFRILHAIVHTSGKNIRLRFISFVGSAVVLALMWVLLTVHVYALSQT